MKLTFQEMALLCALAEKLGWEKEQESASRVHDTLPPTYYRVDDLTHGIDVGFRFLRSRPSPGINYKDDGSKPSIWWVVFEPWNPLESMDDAWELVNAISKEGAKDIAIPLRFRINWTGISLSARQQEFARMICLAAAKAWDIPTELVR